MRPVGPGQVGGQVPGGLIRQRLWVLGGDDEAGMPVGSPPAQRDVGGSPGFGMSSRNTRSTVDQPPGLSGPFQGTARATSFRAGPNCPPTRIFPWPLAPPTISEFAVH